MNNEKIKELFTVKIRAGSRTYFFDVKEMKDSNKYLTISESRKKGDSFEHNRVMIFEEHLKSFSEGLEKAFTYLGTNKK
ncbi:MAG: DUF3276 family protein [Candidatus Cloacimonetes bacterium]|nr:DUF3276 family protein [Candidatus Cloacimonadota bacterium]